MKKTLTVLLLCVLVGTLVFGLCACGEKYPTKEGYTTVVLRYNGAEGKEKEEVLYVEKGEDVSLPSDPERQGYGFVGWEHEDLILRDKWNCGQNDLLVFEAAFEKVYDLGEMTCAVRDNEGQTLDFAEGEYPAVNIKVMDVVVKAGYKATFYSKRNFEGKRADVVCYKGFLNRRVHSIKVEKIESEEELFDHELTDDDLSDLLKTYAPKIWWATSELYYASTVEDGMENMTRTASNDGYYYNLDAVGTDPFFGNDENCPYPFVYGKKETGAKIYAFAVEKAGGYLALCYYVYEPFNYGKKMLGQSYGDHIGDWEHVSVVLKMEKNGAEVTVKPLFMETSYHDWRDYTPYDKLEKEGTHPVAYIAERSHGTWASAGEHAYINILGVKLIDFCSKGYAWDTWSSIETYAYDARTWQGRGIGDSVWNACFDRDYQDPLGTAVIHWGNKGLPNGVFYKHFVTGPTGPEQKTSLYNYYTINKPQTYTV